MKARKIIVVALIVLILGGVTWYRQMSQMTTREIRGKVLAIDVAARKASLEFMHPKTGKAIQLDGHVPENCDIQIDGRPGKMSDIQVGETINVKGTLFRNGTMEAQWVKLTRTASQPASGAAQP